MAGSREIFKDNIRPAELLLRVYRLLENDQVHTAGEMVTALRTAVGGSNDEECMLIYNEIFVGLIRERADMPASAFKATALNNLLRQSIVASCTAIDTFLPSLLRTHLPTVIRLKGRDFFPQDTGLQEYFQDLTFGLADTLRLIGDPDAPLFIANKILGLTKFKYLSSKKGIHAVGALLQLEKPWNEIAGKLGRDDRKELMKVIDETTRRRNDIVHRADRPQSAPEADQQEIGFAWTQQAVDTISHVCLALDELVTAKMAELEAAHSVSTMA